MEIENQYEYDTEVVWNYEMRRDMQEIIPGLFLGPFYSAKNLNLLQFHKITHILCVTDTREEKIIKPYYPGQFIYLVVNVSDDPLEILIPHFKKVKNFIDNALLSNGKVLVHSNVGISRGPTFVISYLMETKKISFDEAFKLVKTKRFCIKPNLGFELQLKEYEPILNARSMAASNNNNNIGSSVKKNNRRRYEEDDDDIVIE